MFVRFIFLIVGLVLNALGNGLTVASNFGSGVQTAASVNLSNIFPFAPAIFIFAFGLACIIINQLLLWKFDIIKIIKGLIFISFFSYGVNFFTNIFLKLNINGHGAIINALFSIIGITIIGVAISVNQRANLLMHPNDETSNILRFKFFKGSAPISQIVDMLPPVVIIIICGLVSRHLDAVNIGTLYYFLCNGIVVKYADRWIAPSLIHNFSKSESSAMNN